MTLDELITDLKAAGANQNTMQLAMNCYELGLKNARSTTWTQAHWTEYEHAIAAAEREACAQIAKTPISGEQDDITMEAKDRVAKAIRARGKR